MLDAIDSHIDHFLMKPIDYDKLIHTVEIIAEDISVKRRLKLEQEHFRALLDFQPNIVILTDGKGLLKANRAFFEFFGYETLEDFFKENECICDFFIEEEGFLSKSIGESWVHSLQTSPDKSAKAKIRHPQTQEEHIFVARYGELDKEELFVVSFTDITQMERQSNLLEKLSTTDTLTGAMNRLKFNEIFELEFNKAVRYGHGLSVIMMDIDHFKQINDTYGHECGDVVLTVLSAEMEKRIRKTDTFARWGGEEFIILFPFTGLEASLLAAERLRLAVAETPFDIGDQVLNVTISCGLSQLKPGIKFDILVAQADSALYDAKHNGRNRICTYSAAQSTAA